MNINTKKMLEILSPYKNKITAGDFSWIVEDGPTLSRYIADILQLLTSAGVEPVTSTPSRVQARFISLIKGQTICHYANLAEADDRSVILKFAESVGLEMYEVDDPSLTKLVPHLVLFTRPGGLRDALDLPHIQTLLGAEKASPLMHPVKGEA